MRAAVSETIQSGRASLPAALGTSIGPMSPSKVSACGCTSLIASWSSIQSSSAIASKEHAASGDVQQLGEAVGVWQVACCVASVRDHVGGTLVVVDVAVRCQPAHELGANRS